MVKKPANVFHDAYNRLVEEMTANWDKKSKPAINDFWEAAWSALIPRDERQSDPMPLAMLLRSRAELPDDFRERLADLLDPTSFAANYKLICVDDRADSDKQFGSFIEMLKRVDEVEKYLKEGMIKSEAVEAAAKSANSNVDSIYRALRAFRQMWPEIFADRNLSPGRRKRKT